MEVLNRHYVDIHNLDLKSKNANGIVTSEKKDSLLVSDSKVKREDLDFFPGDDFIVSDWSDNDTVKTETDINVKEEPTMDPAKCHVCGLAMQVDQHDSCEARWLNHHDKEQITCKDCDNVFGPNGLLDRHVENVRVLRLDKLEEPPVTRFDEFESLPDLSSHGTNDRGEDKPEKRRRKVFKCHKCAITLLSGKALRKHIQVVHDTDDSFKCDNCHKVFSTFVQLNRHIRRAHDKDYQCETCGKKYEQPCKLKEHISFEHQQTVESFKCEKCEKILRSKNSRDRHYMTIHGDLGENLKCAQCEKTFFNQTLLDKHFKAKHAKIKDHLCDKCDKSFVEIFSLYRHIRHAHAKNEDSETVTNFKCDLCNKTFMGKYYLQRHNRAVHNLVDENEKHWSCFHALSVAENTQRNFPFTGTKEMPMLMEKMKSPDCNSSVTLVIKPLH